MVLQRPTARPPLGLGLAAVTLGAIGLMLFVLPILAIPMAGAGLALGIIGSSVAIARRSIDLRLSMAGVVVCGLALASGFAMAYAPGDYLDPRFPTPASAPISIPRDKSARQNAPERRSAPPPPAQFRGCTSSSAHRPFV